MSDVPATSTGAWHGARPAWLSSGRLVPAIILAVPLVVTLAGFWPGTMSADTFSIVGEVAAGRYTNWHTPIINAIWHPFWQVGIGTGWVLVLQNVVFLAGAYLVLRAAFGRIGASVGAAVVAVAPTVLGMLGYISRDTWYTAALVAGFGACVRASQRNGARHWVWLGAGLVMCWFALAARQNAAAAIVVTVAVIVALALPAALRRGSRARWFATVAVGGIIATLVLMATQYGAGKALHVKDVDPEAYGRIYDLAALSPGAGRNLIPADVMPQRSLKSVTDHFNVDTVNSYLVGTPPVVGYGLSHAKAVEVSHAWQHAIEHAPLGFLSERGRMFIRELGITRREAWVYHPRIDPNTQGFALATPDLNAKVRSYLNLFDDDQTLDGSIVHAAWIYLLLSLAAAIVLLRSRAAPWVVVGAMAFSGVLFQVGVYLGETSVLYRFEFPVVVTGSLCTLVLARVLWDAWTRRRSVI